MAIDPIAEVESEDRFRIEMDGVALTIPPMWEGRITRSAGGTEPGGVRTVTHVSTVPLPPQRGDYGSNVVERLGSDDIFIALVEFGPEAANTRLFPAVSLFPVSLDPNDFRPRQLQRVIPGQAGKQTFFTYRGRAFCIYAVLGSFARRSILSERVGQVLKNFSIGDES